MDHEITCPHCGYKDGYSWEASPNSQGDWEDAKCGSCGKDFQWYREVSVTYESRMKP